MSSRIYTPSKYSPIWENLKRDLEARVVAHPALHRRIIKAVIKRKDEDLGYKVLNAEMYKKAKLSYTIEGNVITFRIGFIPIICLGAL